MPKCKSPRPPLLIRFMAEHFSEDCLHLRRVDEMRLSYSCGCTKKAGCPGFLDSQP